MSATNPGSIGLPHSLHVLEEFDPDNPGDSFELEHRGDCPTHQVEFEGGHGFLQCTCAVGEWEDTVLDTFRHSEAPATGWDNREPLAPGIHSIEAWVDTYRNQYGYVEREGGLRLAGDGVS